MYSLSLKKDPQIHSSVSYITEEVQRDVTHPLNDRLLNDQVEPGNRRNSINTWLK